VSLPVDSSELQQVVTNLVVNAVHAMTKPGVVRLRLAEERASPPVNDASTDLAARACLVIDVNDEGKGIPQEILPRIFEPFFTTKDVGEGTGLGLAVSYGIVREHGGWITVDSKVDRGSTFRVFLPRQAGS
jgi:signal transduction histidine kinase